MVTKIANGTNVDTYNALDNYGIEPDYIFVGATNANEFATWAGNDVIDASRATFNQFISNFYLGIGDDQLLGTNGQDWIYDGAGNDVIIAGGGNDRVHADMGDDVYYGGAGIDKIDFRYLNVRGPAFSDPVAEGVVFDLAKTTVQDLGIRGHDRFFGFEYINGTGANDTLYGNGGANDIAGDAGKDTMDGRAGADSISGGDGADIYTGGAGADQLTLLEFTSSRDIVRYTNVSESNIHAGTYDTIVGFSKGTAATADRIDLHAIDADAAKTGNQDFTWKGSTGFTLAGGEVRVVTSGSDTLIYVDNDADSTAEMMIKVVGVTGLAKADFVL